MFDSRTRRLWKFILVAWGGALVLMLGSQAVFGRMGPADLGTGRVVIPTLTTAVAIAWTFVWAVVAFHRLDEFQKEAGKFAWYWGGTVGIAVSLVAYVFIGMGGLHWLDPVHSPLGRDLFRSFQTGYLLGVGGPFLGFLVARLWWSMAKR